jgi:hypothetical protein
MRGWRRPPFAGLVGDETAWCSGQRRRPPANTMFFRYLNSAQICKFKFSAFPRSKIIQTVHAASFKTAEQLCHLAQLPIVTRIHVINFGTNSNLNLLWILKGFKPWGKILVNSLNLYLDLILTKVNLVQHTCMQEIGVPIQVSTWLDLKIRIRVWILNSNQTTVGFHSSFEVT